MCASYEGFADSAGKAPAPCGDVSRFHLPGFSRPSICCDSLAYGLWEHSPPSHLRSAWLELPKPLVRSNARKQVCRGTLSRQAMPACRIPALARSRVAFRVSTGCQNAVGLWSSHLQRHFGRKNLQPWQKQPQTQRRCRSARNCGHFDGSWGCMKERPFFVPRGSTGTGGWWWDLVP